MKTDLRVTAQCFHFLSVPTRLAILQLLAENPLNVTTIARTLGITRKLTSEHLRLLRIGRLVNVERWDRITRYSVDKAAMKAMASDLRSLMPR